MSKMVNFVLSVEIIMPLSDIVDEYIAGVYEDLEKAIKENIIVGDAINYAVDFDVDVIDVFDDEDVDEEY